MTQGHSWGSAGLGVVTVALMAFVPAIRDAMQRSMTAQMLVQLPLLVIAGGLAAPALSSEFRRRVRRWNLGGISGAVLATVVAAYWMLPRSLDASTVDQQMFAAKHLAVPFLIGLPFAASWPQMGFVVRGMLAAEVLATFFRLGWLYRVSPVRLCNSYGLDDQRRLGAWLLIIGAVLLAALAWKLLWGRFGAITTAAVGATPTRGSLGDSGIVGCTVRGER